MSNSRIALLVGAALAVGVGVVSVSTSTPVISKVFTSVSGLATGDGRKSNPLDVTVHTSGSISGTGAAAAPISAGDQLGFGYALFGDGFDGNATISSNTTMSRDMFYEDLTIDLGANYDTNGWRLFVKGTLTLNGTISRNGNNGVNSGVCQGTLSTCIVSGSGAARAGNMLPASCAGGGCTSVDSPFPSTAGTGSTVGGAGAGANGRSGARGQGGAGGAGGGGSVGNNGANGTGGGAITTSATDGGNIHDWRVAVSNRYRSSAPEFGSGNFNSGAGIGGCGGQGGTTTPPPGGGAAGSAGWVAVLAHKIEGSGSINAIGGTGGVGSTCNSTTRGAAGGGGGGAGGIVVILIGTGAFPTTSVAGGSGGAGGSNSLGHAGGAGGSGGEGYTMLFRAGV